jgi:Fe-S cluster biogenesis protein NfuA
MPADRAEHQWGATRLKTLLQEVEACSDPALRDMVEELIRAILDLHGDGLARLLTLTQRAQHTGPALVEMFTHDELLTFLFMLHGLHPVAVQTRVEQALVEIRPDIAARGYAVEMVGIENGIAKLHLVGHDHGCSATATALVTTIEDAINKAAPDLDGMQIESLPDPAQRTSKPVQFIPRRQCTQ